MKNDVLELCEFDKYILALFPESEIFPDGVVCDLDLLKERTIEIIKDGREDDIKVYFSLNCVEVIFPDTSLNFLLSYSSVLETMRSKIIIK